MPHRIRQALISVHDKTDLDSLAGTLKSYAVRMISTGGTAAYLKEHGFEVTPVADLTGAAELFGGRVKTLHPHIFAGILARPNYPEDARELEQMGLAPIDLVVVNLYPFIETIAQPGVTLAQAIEQIDIGGIALIRAAAKNHDAVAVVVDPRDYDRVGREMQSYDGAVTATLRKRLAIRAFQTSTEYDAAIANYLDSLAQKDFTPSDQTAAISVFPRHLVVAAERTATLRYGENPHQLAAVYRRTGPIETSLVTTRQLRGKELSYNNIGDGEAALELVREFDRPAVAIIKHANPCGVALGDSPAIAYRDALACDPDSAFGGVVGCNREVDAPTAEQIAEVFTEVVIAPSFAADALEVLKRRKNLRLLATGPFTPRSAEPMIRSFVGGFLVQDRDASFVPRDKWRRVTEVALEDEKDLDALDFAMRVVKWVKSNAIVLTTRTRTVGIGAGQMSRVDSLRLAIQKARSPLEGCYLASDAFFPFRDSIDSIAPHKIRAIVQPGGSVRDEEVVAACNEYKIPMYFTGRRHFRH
jgi:phosphoribosylaminoimidazolecarboxamide formyltransferase/IMP cyclohydrolase